MKNFKKLLSVLVMLAMLASFVPASMAASYIYEDQAIILNNLGIFKGSSATSFVPDLGGAVTREQGVIQLVRTLGKESDAIAMTDIDADKILIVFSDAKTINSWSKKYIAWAVNNKIVAGYPNGKFGPQDALSGKAYAKLLLSALGHTVDAAGFEAACFLMRDKGIMTWGTRGTLYYVLSFSEAQKFNDKEALVRDDLVALSYAALKLPYSNTYVTTTLRNKTAIQALIEAGKVTKDKAIAAYLYFKELMPLTEAAVAAYEAAPVTSLAAITAAEALKAAADTAVAEYVKGNVAGLAAVVNFNVKFNLNNAWIKADYDGFVARIAAKATAIANAKTAETAAQAAANAALAAYEAAPITTLAQITAAEALGVAAANAINACVDAAFKTAKLATKAVKDTAVAAAKALLNGQVTDATAAVAAYEAAPVATYANIDAALALYNVADVKVIATQDPVANAALRARLNAVALKASIKVFDTKTLQVNFNKPLTQAQKDAAAVTLKFYSVVIANAKSWVGNNLQVKNLDAALVLTAGNYTVEVGAVAADTFVLPVTVNAEKAATLSITSTYVKKEAVAIAFGVKNQYDQAMTVAAGNIIATAVNMTDSTRLVIGTSLASLDFSNCQIGDVVRISAYINSDASVNTIGDVIVSNVYVQSVTLGTPVLPSGTRFTTGLAGVKITATMIDNKGGVIKSFAGLTIVGNNITITDINNTTGVITFTLGAIGPASLTIINPNTGATAVQNMTIVGVAAPTTVDLLAPTTNFVAGAAASVVAYKVYNQFNEEILAANLPTNVSDIMNVASSNPLVATVAIVGKEIKVTPVSAGTVTITANMISSGLSDSLVITVLAPTALFPVNISVSGTPNTTVEMGIANSNLKILVKDQFGNPINTIGTYTFSIASSVPAKATVPASVAMSGANGLTNAITVTPVAVGTTSVTVKLMDGATQVGSSVVVNYNVVAAPVATSMSISTTQVVKDATQAIAYTVLSQNGIAMTGLATTASAVNLTDAGRTVGGSLASMNFAGCNVGDVIRISAYLDSNPAVNTTKDVTVVNTATVTLGDLSVVAAGLTAGKTGVTVTATMKTASGDAVSSLVGLDVIGSNVTITNEDDATGVITFTLGAAGSASITVLNMTTGVFVTKTFTILAAAPVPPVLVATSVTVPATLAVDGMTAYSVLVHTVRDQNGTAMAVALPLTTVVASSDITKATVSIVAGEIRVAPVAAGTAIIYVSFNGTTNVCTVTVAAADVLTSAYVQGFGPDYVSAAGRGFFDLGSTATFTCYLYNQFATALRTTSPVTVTWSVTSTVAGDISVDGVVTAFAAGETKAFDKSSSVGLASTSTITILGSNNLVSITAKAGALAASSAILMAFYDMVPSSLTLNGASYEGTVSYINAEGFFVINTSVGNAVFANYSVANAQVKTFKVDNTTTTMALFVSNLSIGDTVLVEFVEENGTFYAKYSLTNP